MLKQSKRNYREQTGRWYRDVRALAADITAWVANWNTDPKPFIWRKTADEILARLAGYYRAINQ